MNNIVLTNVRITRDLELKRTNNTAILNFGVADNMKVNGEDAVLYHNCTAFGKQAEHLAQYGTKGGRVNLVGRMQPNNYTSKEGKEVNTVQIQVERIEIVDFKPNGQNQTQPQMNMNPGMPQMTQQPMNQSMGGGNPQMNMNSGIPQMPPFMNQAMNQPMNQPMNQGMGVGMPQTQPQMNMNPGMPQMAQQPMNQSMGNGNPQQPDLSAANFGTLMPDELPFN